MKILAFKSITDSSVTAGELFAAVCKTTRRISALNIGRVWFVGRIERCTRKWVTTEITAGKWRWWNHCRTHIGIVETWLNV